MRKKPKTTRERPPFSIGEQVVASGSRRRVDLPVARLPAGPAVSLPVTVLHGAHHGPTIWLSSAVHGDELNGIPTIRRLLSMLDAPTLRGTVVAAPVVNVFGLANESRYMPDRRDLNRCFPGSARGSLAGQLAHLFMTEVVEKCQLGIDFHTGSDGRTNLPQIRCDLESAATRADAEAFAPRVLMHSTTRDGSLRAAATNMGIRCLLFEGGEALRFDDEAIESGVTGTLRVMRHLDMIDEAPEPTQEILRVRGKTRWVRARRSGFAELRVRLGARVEHGSVLGKLHNTNEVKASTLTSPIDGVVIGLQTTATVHKGDAVAHIAPV